MEKWIESRLKGSKQFYHFYFLYVLFIFIGSGSFAIVERGIYDSTPIVLKKLHDGTSSDIKKISTKET